MSAISSPRTPGLFKLRSKRSSSILSPTVYYDNVATILQKHPSERVSREVRHLVRLLEKVEEITESFEVENKSKFLTRCSECLEYTTFKQGEALCHRGYKTEDMYIFIRGSISVYEQRQESILQKFRKSKTKPLVDFKQAIKMLQKKKTEGPNVPQLSKPSLPNTTAKRSQFREATKKLISSFQPTSPKEMKLEELGITDPHEQLLTRTEENLTKYFIDNVCSLTYVKSLEQGECFNEKTLLTQQYRSAYTYVAAEDTEMVVLRKPVFEKIFQGEIEMLKEKKEFVKKTFSFTSQNITQIVAKCLNGITFQNGQNIYVQGEEAKGIYFIHKGEVKLSYYLSEEESQNPQDFNSIKFEGDNLLNVNKSPKTKKVDIAIACEKEFIGEESVLLNRPRNSFTATANKKDVTLYYLDPNHLPTIQSWAPQILVQLKEQSIRRLRWILQQKKIRLHTQLQIDQEQLKHQDKQDLSTKFKVFPKPDKVQEDDILNTSSGSIRMNEKKKRKKVHDAHKVYEHRTKYRTDIDSQPILGFSNKPKEINKEELNEPPRMFNNNGDLSYTKNESFFEYYRVYYDTDVVKEGVPYDSDLFELLTNRLYVKIRTEFATRRDDKFHKIQNQINYGQKRQKIQDEKKKQKEQKQKAKRASSKISTQKTPRKIISTINSIKSNDNGTNNKAIQQSTLSRHASLEQNVLVDSKSYGEESIPPSKSFEFNQFKEGHIKSYSMLLEQLQESIVRNQQKVREINFEKSWQRSHCPFTISTQSSKVKVITLIRPFKNKFNRIFSASKPQIQSSRPSSPVLALSSEKGPAFQFPLGIKTLGNFSTNPFNNFIAMDTVSSRRMSPTHFEQNSNTLAMLGEYTNSIHSANKNQKQQQDQSPRGGGVLATPKKNRPVTARPDLQKKRLTSPKIYQTSSPQKLKQQKDQQSDAKGGGLHKFGRAMTSADESQNINSLDGILQTVQPPRNHSPEILIPNFPLKTESQATVHRPYSARIQLMGTPSSSIPRGEHESDYFKVTFQRERVQSSKSIGTGDAQNSQQKKSVPQISKFAELQNTSDLSIEDMKTSASSARPKSKKMIRSFHNMFRPMPKNKIILQNRYKQNQSNQENI